MTRALIHLHHPDWARLVPPSAVVDALEALFSEPEPGDDVRPSIATILAVVAERRGARVMDLVASRRTRVFARARQEVMWLARRLTLHSTPVIGRHVGGRDHTTVLHALAVVDRRRESEPTLVAELDLMGAEACRRALHRRRS